MKSSIDFGLQSHLANRLGVRLPGILFIVAALLSTTAALTAQEHGESSGDAARVMALETLWKQAEVDKDVRALSQLVAETFFYVDIGGSLRTKSEFLESVKSGPEHPTEIRNESLVAHAYANTVVATGVYREKGTIGGKHYSQRGRFTDTWIQVNGAWLCVASQSTLTEK
jgi:ketosteroid isomerase-like protein